MSIASSSTELSAFSSGPDSCTDSVVTFALCSASGGFVVGFLPFCADGGGGFEEIGRDYGVVFCACCCRADCGCVEARCLIVTGLSPSKISLKSTKTSPMVQLLSRMSCDSVDIVGDKMLKRSLVVTLDVGVFSVVFWDSNRR